MNEIKCPNCQTVFQIDEADYQSIVKQIRDQEFEKEISEREKQYQIDKENSIQLTTSKLEKVHQEELHKQEEKVLQLNQQLEHIEKDLTHEFEKKQSETVHELEKKYSDDVQKKSMEILDLKNQIQLLEKEKEIVVKDAVVEKEKEIDHLQNQLVVIEQEAKLKEKGLIDSYEEKIKSREEQISYYKDFKARQSTKMIGESLEQHCSVEFNQLRPLFGKDVYFEKDNDAKTGSKGDFIYREKDEDGIEFISIMFEMKNEADETSSKHKNEDFLKELDKDRREKNCEYAVLVSLLEMDNDFYNNGIVDMSHKYPKMYVVRPQFFIPLITLLRGASLNSLQYKKELVRVQNQNLDITHFEENLIDFKEKFGRNYRLASERFQKAIEEIDKSIEHLQKIKDNLIKSEDNLRLANSKAEDLSITKLTRNAPSVHELFDQLKED